MATITKIPCRVGYTISGNSPEVREAPEGASQTYKAGAILFKSATALRALPTASISRVDCGQGIAGLSLADAGNNTVSTTLTRYVVANDDTVFLTNIASRTSVATATLAYRYIGTACQGSINSSRFYVNVKMVAATNSICVIRDFVRPDTVGDTYGRVYFQFLRAARCFR